MTNIDEAARRAVEAAAVENVHDCAGPAPLVAVDITDPDWPFGADGGNGGHVAASDNSGHANDNHDRGPYIGTLTGRFYPFDPAPSEVDIAHIAHSLAMTCRYTGACIRYYSTAEHSVHIARWLIRCYPPSVALAGLLHDAPEALSGFGDTARPSKVKAPIIKATEESIYSRAIAPAFDLPGVLPAEVHEADSRIIADEMRQNMRECDPAYNDPLGVTLEYWSPEEAETEFLAAFWALQNMREAA